MARNALYEYGWNGTVATFDFRDGTRIDLSMADLTSQIIGQLIGHGLKQKVGDAAAIPRDTTTGRSASDAEKIQAMIEVIDRLRGGEWNATREGGGGGTTGGLLLRALIELYPNKSREDLVAYLAGKTDKDKAALRASPKIAPVIERLKAEAGKAKGVNADALLDELDG